MATSKPIACTLTTEQRPARAELMKSLGASLERVHAHGCNAELDFTGGAEIRTRLESFVVAESSCCRFVDFALQATPQSSRLTVTAPADAEWAIRGLVAGFVAGWEGLA